MAVDEITSILQSQIGHVVLVVSKRKYIKK